MRVALKALAMAASLGVMTWSSAPAKADDPSYLTIGAGAWEVFRDQQREPELDVAYRSDQQLWIFKPHAGLVVAKDGDFVAYAGLLTDIYWGKRFVTTLSASAATWGGGGYDLGSRLAFRSGLEGAWRFDDTSRLGLGIYHLSNAGITQRNPGAESALVVYSYPLGHTVSHQAQAVQPPAPTVAITDFSKGN